MKKLSGFSLMEMMIVLLIVSVVAAASAPMVNKKLLNAASDKSPWVWTGSSKSIAYNLQGSDPQAAVVGAVTRPTAASNARFYIHTNNQTPQIALGHGNNSVLKILSAGTSFFATNNVSSANNSVVIGHGASIAANANNSVVIGQGASINRGGTTSVVIGQGAKSSNHSIIAIGDNASAEDVRSIAIGANVTLAGSTEGSIVVGSNSSANGSCSMALGYNATVSQTGAVAIGSNAIAGTQNGIAIGTDSSTGTSPNNIAIGRTAGASNTNSIAIGTEAKASGNENPISIGASSQATDRNAIAIGTLTKAHHAGSIAIGGSANVPNHDLSIAIGERSKAEGYRNTVLGADAAVEGSHDASVAIGYNAVASAAYATAIGYNARATYQHQITLGTANDIVYIPGHLIVGKNTYLGADKGKWQTWLKTQYDGGDYFRFSYIRRNGIRGAEDLDTDPSCGWKGGLIGPDYANVVNDIFTSDRRLKNVGKTFVGGLNEIKKLEVFNYTFKSDKSKTPRVGVMAQDLQKIFPNAVMKGEDGFLRIRMEDMFYALVNAVKELATRSENHDKQIAELTKQNKELQKTIEKLEKRINDLEKK